MTNVDPSPNPNDPIEEFVAAAHRIEALKAELISRLGQTATHEGGRLPRAETISQASRIIVESLTEITDAISSAKAVETRAAPEYSTPQPIQPTIAEEQTPDAWTLETMTAEVETILADHQTGEVRIGAIAKMLAGGKRLPRSDYGKLIAILNHHPATTYMGEGNYQVGVMSKTKEEVTVSVEASPELESLAAEIPASTELEQEDNDDIETLSDEELIGMVARFMGRRPYFTGNDLRQFLLENEAVAPEEVNGIRIHAFIEEFMPYVEEYYFDKGDQVVWSDNVSDPNAVQQAMEGKKPRGKTYVLGFKPRTVIKVGKRFMPVRPEASEELTVPETETETEQSPSQHERGITKEQTQLVIDAVANIGDELKWDSLLEILTDPEDLNLPEEAAEEYINAALADGLLFYKGIRGRKGVSLYSPSKRIEAEIVDLNAIETIEREVDKYALVVEAVIDFFDTIEYGEGRAYDKLWRATGSRLKDHLTFEEFKEKVRRMRDDHYVLIPENQRLHTRSPNTKARRGNKVRLVSPELREEWKSKKQRTRILTEAKDHELGRYIS